MRAFLATFLLTGLAACLPPFPAQPSTDTGTSNPTSDVDGDGYTPDDGDCDDGDASVHPGAQETCNGIDDDCDQATDEDVPDAPVWYLDADQDGVGLSTSATRACSQPNGYSAAGGDCDDTNNQRFPGNPEVCDGIDNDCDQAIDVNAIDATTWYADLDGDTFGDANNSELACDAPVQHVADATDCNDGDAAINPDAQEVCDPQQTDEDCDGSADDLDPSVTGQTTYYADLDHDGYGDENDPGTPSCAAPPDTATVGGDCVDTDPAFHPGAPETDCADPNDYNCDNSTGFADNDADGSPACLDCDDGNPNAHPGGTEVCDPLNADEDCDGGADDLDPQAPVSGSVNLWDDVDRDTYGDAAGVPHLGCDVDPGESANHLDCDDSRADVNPGEIEVCDPLDADEDCDGKADDADPSATLLTAFYPDTDGDAFGDSTAAAVLRCDPLGSQVADDTDCNDGDAAVNPGEAEVCDPLDVDENCNLKADDLDPTVDPASYLTFFKDTDHDAYGDPLTARQACEPKASEIAVGGDCNDANPAINPGATEVCDVGDVDEDCDGGADDLDPEGNATGQTNWFVDGDGDFFGAGAPVSACDAPGGRVSVGTDCDDGDPQTFPGAPELCDGVQNDCSDGAWVNDDGHVTLEDAGGSTDLTALFASGTAATPAVVSLSSDGTVEVCPGTYFVTATVDSGAAVSFLGFSGIDADVTLDGGGTEQVLTATGNADVTVTDVTLADGFGATGGAARVDGATLTIDGATIQASTATNGGGVAAVNGATLVVDHATIDGCSATDGGAIWADAGTTLQVLSATLSNGTAVHGGAVWTEASATFDLGVWSGNSASEGAGVWSDAGAVTATQTVLDSNDATVSGGGWFLTGTAAIAANNVGVTANTAPVGAGMWIEGGSYACSGLTGRFTDNVATTSGGGAELTGGTLTSTACDWAPGNTPEDVHTPVGAFSYGLNATFSCTSAGCL